MAPSTLINMQHDDAVTSTTHELMKEVTDGRQSLNGCPAAATMFTTVSGNGEWAAHKG